jgi:hypothetical protein
MNDSNNNLTLENNYLEFYNFKCYSIIKKINNIYIEYINYFINNILQDDNLYNKMLFLKGLTTVNHVFKIIFYYTNNLELSIFHTQKTFYYYTEFLSQIDNTNHDFLQLNSNDAVLFVYKKTINLINKNYSKLNKKNENSKYTNINILDIYNKILFNLFEYITINNNNIINNKFLFVNKLQEIIYIIDKKSIFNSIKVLNNIDIFVYNIISSEFDNTKIISLLQLFIKSISAKKNIDININPNIKNILSKSDINDNKIIKLIIN